MTNERLDELKSTALHVRSHILRMSTGGGVLQELLFPVPICSYICMQSI